MSQRLDYTNAAPTPARAYFAFSQSLDGNRLDPILRELVNLRASQMNGCAFCTDMHVKSARIHGERELRLHHVAVWRESPLFDERERAALEWTEALTQMTPAGISDELYNRVKFELGEDLLAELTFAVVAINGWNRVAVAFTPVPGSSDRMLGLDKAVLA
ncbi:carboxymuconolactone decarboxylase family protein [Pseudoruegeria sp. HB172150]|uniref:carboxymuconolactone decarboxylase family protein n=1 Tax=Pseudoruegeria sp. HB172150 TaxID=2721164 RepID=UPI001555BA57|nr:carboxymuconolactone decarboxylase family protein [Pseudoruegeria sp. HB172150]